LPYRRFGRSIPGFFHENEGHGDGNKAEAALVVQFTSGTHGWFRDRPDRGSDPMMSRFPAQVALTLSVSLSACGGDAAFGAQACLRQGIARDQPGFAACTERETARIVSVREYNNARDREQESSK
jgi:hypothetical protein